MGLSALCLVALTQNEEGTVGGAEGGGGGSGGGGSGWKRGGVEIVGLRAASKKIW